MADSSSTLILDGKQVEQVLDRILNAMRAVHQSHGTLSKEFKKKGLKLGDETFRDLNAVVGHLARTNKALSQIDNMLNRVNRAQQTQNKLAALNQRIRESTDRETRAALRVERAKLLLLDEQKRSNYELTREVQARIRKLDVALRKQRDITQEMKLQRGIARSTQSAHARAGNSEYIQAQAAVGNRVSQERISGALSGDTFRMQARLMANFMVINQISEALRFAARFVVDFDRALFDLQAITASTNTELLSFRDNIVDVANSTKFTAVEVAEAARTLAQAGFSVREVALALDGVARFASATGTTMQEAVDIMSSAISVFNMRAAEATTIANLFTAAINNSKLSQDKLSQSFTYVANTAAQSGVSITELTAVLGGLANAGIRTGSTIGTNLRALMIALQAPTDELREKLLRMGVSMRDVDLSANGIIGVIENLSDAGFTAADGFEVFEVRAANAFAALLGQRNSLRELEGDIQGTNAAFEASDIQMRSLANTFANTQSIFGAFIQDALEPLTRGLQSLLVGFNNFMQVLSENEGAVKTFGAVVTFALVAASSALLVQITRLAPATVALAGSMTAAGASGGVMAGGIALATNAVRAFFAALGPVGWGILGVSLAVTGLVTVLGNLNGAQREAEEAYDRAEAATREATGAYEEQRDTVAAVGDEINSLINQQRQLTGEDGATALANRVAQLEERFGDLGLTLDDVADSYDGVLRRMQEFGAEQRAGGINAMRNRTLALREEIDTLRDLAEERRDNLNSGEATGDLNRLAREMDLPFIAGFNRTRNTGRMVNARAYQEAGLGNVFDLQYRRVRGMQVNTDLVRAAYEDLQSLSADHREVVSDLIEQMEGVIGAMDDLERTTQEAADSEAAANRAAASQEATNRFSDTLASVGLRENTIQDILAAPALAQNTLLLDRALGSGLNLRDAGLIAPDGVSESERRNFVDEQILSQLRTDGLLDENYNLRALEPALTALIEEIRTAEDSLNDGTRRYIEESTQLFDRANELRATAQSTQNDANDRIIQGSRGVFRLQSSRAQQVFRQASGRLGDVRNRDELNAASAAYSQAVSGEARARLSAALNRELQLTPDQIDRLFAESGGNLGFNALEAAARRLDFELLADQLTLLELATNDTANFIEGRMEQVIETTRRIDDIERRVALQTQQREIQAARRERERFLSDTPIGSSAQSVGNRYGSGLDTLRLIQEREMARLQQELTDLRINDREAEERIAAMRQQHETEISEEQRRREEAIREARLQELDIIRQQQELILDANRELMNPAGETRLDMLARQAIALEALNGSFANEMEALMTELQNADPKYRSARVSQLRQEQELRRQRFLEEQRGQRQDGAPIESMDEFWEAIRERTGRGIPGQEDVERAGFSTANVMLEATLAAVERARGAFSQFFRDIVTGNATVEDAFKQMAVSILESMLDVITSKIAEQFVNMILDNLPGGGGGSGGGGGKSFSFKGKYQGGFAGVRRFAAGGISTRDAVPALLQEGEFVMRRSAVSALGADRVRKMNALGNVAVSESRPTPMTQGPVPRDTVNVYVVAPDEKPIPGPKDIVAAITEDMRKGGATKKMVKQVQTGNI